MNNYGSDYPGNGNIEMANSLQYLVEATPQIPVGKIVNSAKNGLEKSGQLISRIITGRKEKPQFIENSPQDARY